jgi:hypothetical protein
LFNNSKSTPSTSRRPAYRRENDDNDNDDEDDENEEANPAIDAEHARVNKDTMRLSAGMKPERNVDRRPASHHSCKNQTNILDANKIAMAMPSSLTISIHQPASRVVISLLPDVTLGMIRRVHVFTILTLSAIRSFADLPSTVNRSHRHRFKCGPVWRPWKSTEAVELGTNPRGRGPASCNDKAIRRATAITILIFITRTDFIATPFRSDSPHPIDG